MVCGTSIRGLKPHGYLRSSLRDEKTGRTEDVKWFRVPGRLGFRGMPVRLMSAGFRSLGPWRRFSAAGGSSYSVDNLSAEICFAGFVTMETERVALELGAIGPPRDPVTFLNLQEFEQVHAPGAFQASGEVLVPGGHLFRASSVNHAGFKLPAAAERITEAT